MPGVLSKSEPAEPIEPPPELEIQNAVATAPHRREIPDDFDLVKFAMDYVFGPDFDPEKINTDGAPEGIPEQIKEPFEKLRGAFDLKPEADIAPFLIAIERIIENLGKMNVYADCEELKIKDLVMGCFWCEHDEIKKGACDIVTQVCKADPECSDFFEDYVIFSELLTIIDNCPDDDFVSKALDALLAILNNNLEGQAMMQFKAGIGIFLNTLRRDKEEWNIKIAAYFLQICGFSEQLLLTLISQEYIPELVVLIAKDRKHSHYYLIKLLTILLEADCDALEELSKAEMDVEEILHGLLESSEGLSALKDEREACHRLLQVIARLQQVERPLYDRG